MGGRGNGDGARCARGSAASVARSQRRRVQALLVEGYGPLGDGNLPVVPAEPTGNVVADGHDADDAVVAVHPRQSAI